jgi:hypothetical protein
VSIDTRLTRARRACIAGALEASEHPARMASRAAVAAAANQVRAAFAAVQAIDPGGGGTAALRAELRRRLDALDRRLDAMWSADRRRVVALVMALAATGRAAGYPVQPSARDLVRTTAPGAATDPATR